MTKPTCRDCPHFVQQEQDRPGYGFCALRTTPPDGVSPVGYPQTPVTYENWCERHPMYHVWLTWLENGVEGLTPAHKENKLLQEEVSRLKAELAKVNPLEAWRAADHNRGYQLHCNTGWYSVFLEGTAASGKQLLVNSSDWGPNGPSEVIEDALTKYEDLSKRGT